MSTDDTKVAVLGATGYIGSRLIRADPGRYAELPCRRIESRLDAEALSNEVAEFMGSSQRAALVNCLGMRTGRLDQMHLVNAEVPMRLAEVADSCGFHFIHLASAAEIVRLVGSGTLTEYQVSKRQGTQACLTHENVTVVRIFNLRGLPHQVDSGIHAICRTIRALSEGRDPGVLIDTLRDYVSWESVACEITAAAVERQRGMRECSTGIGVRISDIVAALPPDLASGLQRLIKPADLYSSAVGTRMPEQTDVERRTIVSTLAEEVMACAFS